MAFDVDALVRRHPPKMAHHPARIQLEYKDARGWREYLSRLELHSPMGMSNTLARFQGLRPSLFEFSDEFSRMAIPVLLSVGDEDVSCLEANLMLKSVLPNAGPWVAAIPAIQSISKNPHTSMHNWKPSSVLSSGETGDGLLGGYTIFAKLV